MISDLLPETLDVDVHGTGVADILVAPDVVEKLLSGKHLIGRGSQKIQKLQLLGPTLTVSP